MDKGATKESITSTPAWDELEGWTRGRIQEWMQQMIVDEVTEFLGQAKHQRRKADMQSRRSGAVRRTSGILEPGISVPSFLAFYQVPWHDLHPVDGANVINLHVKTPHRRVEAEPALRACGDG